MCGNERREIWSTVRIALLVLLAWVPSAEAETRHPRAYNPQDGQSRPRPTAFVSSWCDAKSYDPDETKVMYSGTACRIEGTFHANGSERLTSAKLVVGGVVVWWKKWNPGEGPAVYPDETTLPQDRPVASFSTTPFSTNGKISLEAVCVNTTGQSNKLSGSDPYALNPYAATSRIAYNAGLVACRSRGDHSVSHAAEGAWAAHDWLVAMNHVVWGVWDNLDRADILDWFHDESGTPTVFYIGTHGWHGSHLEPIGARYCPNPDHTYHHNWFRACVGSDRICPADMAAATKDFTQYPPPSLVFICCCLSAESEDFQQAFRTKAYLGYTVRFPMHVAGARWVARIWELLAKGQTISAAASQASAESRGLMKKRHWKIWGDANRTVWRENRAVSEPQPS